MLELWLGVIAPVVVPLIALVLWPFFPEHEDRLLVVVMFVWGIAGFYSGVVVNLL